MSKIFKWMALVSIILLSACATTANEAGCQTGVCKRPLSEGSKLVIWLAPGLRDPEIDGDYKEVNL